MGRRAVFRNRLACLLMGSALAVALAGILPATTASASGTAPVLMPAAGQFFPVTAVEALDTRNGVGGVPVSPLAAGQTVTFAVDGVGSVPASGVSDVLVAISAFGPSQSGSLQDFDPDGTNPGIWTVPMVAGQNNTVTDVAQVSASGSISLTNASSGTTDAAVTVLGYYQDQTAQTAGDLYAPLAYAAIVDTRSGFGAPQAQIPAGGSLTIQVSGKGGVPADAAGAAMYLGVANESQTGWISAYAAGGTDPGLRVLSYQPGATVRTFWAGALSSSGQLTLANHGSAPVDIMAAVQGYLVSPTASELGTTYGDVTPQRIADTRDGTGGVPATPLPANGSITFTATGVDGVPSTGVSAVAERIAVSNPTASGFVSAYAANGSDPNNAMVNFQGGDGQDNNLTAALVSSVSPTGEQTITNHSSGTVDIIVTIDGYFVAPVVPAAPRQVTASVSGTSATVTWVASFSDGGAPITGYTVAASPDTASVTVDPATFTATLTNLNNATTDTFTVTATNAIGSSVPASQGGAGSATSSDESDVQISIDPATDTESLVSGNATFADTDTSGNTTSGSMTPDTADVLNGSPQALGPGCQGKVKGVNLVAYKPWNNRTTGHSFSMLWTNQIFKIKHAYNYPGTGWTDEYILCSFGGANSWNAWIMYASANAMVMENTKSRMYNYDGGVRIDSRSDVTSSVGFQFGGSSGNSGNVNGSANVNNTNSTVVANSQYTYDTQTDGLWGSQWPTRLNPYIGNRLNTEWLSNNSSGDSYDQEGNSGEALYIVLTGSGPWYFDDVTLVKAHCTEPFGLCSSFR